MGTADVVSDRGLVREGFAADLNPQSLEVLPDSRVEPALAEELMPSTEAGGGAVRGRPGRTVRWRQGLGDAVEQRQAVGAVTVQILAVDRRTGAGGLGLRGDRGVVFGRGDALGLDGGAVRGFNEEHAWRRARHRP